MRMTVVKTWVDGALGPVSNRLPSAYKADARPVELPGHDGIPADHSRGSGNMMDRAAGIEPACAAWKAATSPLGQTRRTRKENAVGWNRTSGLLFTKQPLCHLSYDSVGNPRGWIRTSMRPLRFRPLIRRSRYARGFALLDVAKGQRRRRVCWGRRLMRLPQPKADSNQHATLTVSTVYKTEPIREGREWVGADGWTRTTCLRLMRPALFHMSFVSEWRRGMDSNHRPPTSETGALLFVGRSRIRRLPQRTRLRRCPLGERGLSPRRCHRGGSRHE